MFAPGNQVRKGKAQPAIGRRTAHKLKKEVAVIAAVYGPPERFKGDSLAFIRAMVSSEIQNPDPVRLGAAMRLAEFEHPRRSATDAPPAASPSGLRIDVHSLTSEQRAVLLAIVQSGAVRQADGSAAVPRTIDAPALAAPVASASETKAHTRAAELKASIAVAEKEREELLADIAQHERQQEDEDHRRQHRLRTAGIDFVPFGQRR
jgi:hypothetical protein